jgi:Icc-related predicted phosphoesterase
MSDTHELHRELEVPDGDILIHAGDFTMFGKNLQALRDFNDWLGELPHAHKVVVYGNHEFMLEAELSPNCLLTNATVLINEAVVIEGIKIWGSPLTPLNGEAYGQSNASDRARIYDTIPADTDVVVTHGPPYGVLDSTAEYRGQAGDPELRNAMIRVKPRLHVFGHIHAGYGVRPTKNTLFANAALMGWSGELENRPIVVSLSAVKDHTE